MLLTNTLYMVEERFGGISLCFFSSALYHIEECEPLHFLMCKFSDSTKPALPHSVAGTGAFARKALPAA